jgi:hypothetical protein
MSSQSPFHESQKLVRCRVVNRYQETSIRFVEIDAFKLWEYLMTNKHGLKVGEPSLCLWVDDEEYQHNAGVFDRAGDVEAVNRIVVDMFDAEYGFSQTTTRYARAGESEQVVDILRSHIPPELRDSESCNIMVITGHAVHQSHPQTHRSVLMGLKG